MNPNETLDIIIQDLCLSGIKDLHTMVSFIIKLLGHVEPTCLQDISKLFLSINEWVPAITPNQTFRDHMRSLAINGTMRSFISRSSDSVRSTPPKKGWFIISPTIFIGLRSRSIARKPALYTIFPPELLPIKYTLEKSANSVNHSSQPLIPNAWSRTHNTASIASS
ncbi:hypothetical protein LXL04_026800 [Taraxacum kok-saghyz]